MKYISPWYYTNEALSINQWQDVDELECEEPFEEAECLQDGDDVIEYLNYNPVSIYE